MFDFTLNTPEERVAYINSILPTLLPRQYEAAANYILHLTPEKTVNSFTASLSPKEIPTEELPEPIQNRYTNPKLKPMWELFPEEKAFCEQLKLASTNPETDSSTAYKMRKWRLEIFLDIGTISQIIRNPIPLYGNTQLPPPIDLDALIDYTNAFHIKQIIANYTLLRQSDEHKPIAEYFDFICERTPLKRWQKHLLVGRIEGVPQTTLAVQIAQLYNKALSPSYMSQVMRNIYTKIAEQAELELEKYTLLKQSWAWEPCTKCGTKKYYKEFRRMQLDRAETGKPATCKQCEENAKK